ncbi:DUF4255 domain-containing protein [Mastigocoleus testarum]|uniref:Pvc16 N-terminal domain-containing protein n=1 Tax=Mastigocoleus testarum BC008 TaxID=371196 RepID=A0A0V7ZM97_9CYAN|nr:DUF4255 domain-containing protein [Mastigocoleus testarum]KST65689.1 hypothetical protein BC008_22175 [Mastigocoleus testarum BC008]
MNYLAIATVTTALKNILQVGINNEMPGTQVTTVRPDKLNAGVKERKVNIFLYQAAPNRELYTIDLTTHRPKDGMTQKHALALDLNYILTFYGNEMSLETQKLLGLTVKTLVDYSKLSKDIIQATIDRDPSLRDSTLANQVQEIKFIPNIMTPEELLRIWSISFQSPYSLSLAYQARAVTIEGEVIGKSALPVRSTSIYLSFASPTIKEIEVEPTSFNTNKAITIESSLIIYGDKLNSDDTKIKIGNARITPQKVEDKVIKLDLSSIPTSEIKNLKAGVQSLQVIQTPKNSDRNPVKSIESNALPLVLRPNIVGDIVLSQNKANWENLYSGEVALEIDLKVSKRQRIYLLLNEISNSQPEAYVFPAKKIEDNLNRIVFSVRNVKIGEYLARIQVDGAESPLKIDTDPNSNTYEEYYQPKISISHSQSLNLNGNSSRKDISASSK